MDLIILIAVSAISTAALIVAIATRRTVLETVERLKSLIKKLNDTITAEAAQQKAVIENLRKQIAEGVDTPQLSEALDQLEASVDRVAAIVPDEPADVAEPGGEAPAVEA